MSEQPISYKTKIAAQLSFAQTGRQPANCPDCGKSMTFRVGGIHKLDGRRTRDVKGTCRHCGTYFSFLWR